MTDEKMALLALVEQASDGDFVREMLAFAAERMMEVEARTGGAAWRAFGPAQRLSRLKLGHAGGHGG